MSRAAMQQALEALEKAEEVIEDEYGGTSGFATLSCAPAITALRAALAEPEQEPVAWQIDDGRVTYVTDRDIDAQEARAEGWRVTPLTDAEMPTLFVGGLALNSEATTEIVRAVEKAHGIGESK